MIKLNLLPEELKVKKSALDSVEIPVIPIIAGVVGIALGLYVLLTVLEGVKKSNYENLRKKFDSLSPEQKMVKDLDEQLRLIELNISAIEMLDKNRVIWAELLNSLSDSMLPNVWLASMSVQTADQSPALVLNGFVAESSQAGTALSAQFMNALKSNKDFFKFFKSINLESITSATRLDREIMAFKIICAFK